jgi:hypothetical protein
MPRLLICIEDPLVFTLLQVQGEGPSEEASKKRHGFTKCGVQEDRCAVSTGPRVAVPASIGSRS